MVGPILSSSDFVTVDLLIPMLGMDDEYPIFCSSMLARNKLKTRSLTVNGRQYRLYYRYDAALGVDVYYCGHISRRILVPFVESGGRKVLVSEEGGSVPLMVRIRSV